MMLARLQPDIEQLADLARSIAATPIAVITDLDLEHQWLQCATGLETGERTAPVIAFCRATSLQHGPLMVADTWEDARFDDHPLVTATPSIRFYCGMPLIGSTGQTIGALCLIDRVPRQLPVQQRTALEQLAQVVVRQLEARPGPELLTRQQMARMLTASSEAPQEGCIGLLRCQFLDYERVSATLGGATAEQLIEEAARRLRHSIPRDAQLARFSDAELMVLVPLKTGKTGAEAIAQRTLALCSHPFRLPPHRMALDVAIGIAISEPGPLDPDALFSDTAMAVRLARHGSCSGYRFADAVSREQARRDYALESAFREAVAERQLVAWFQPIVDLASGEPRGFEALARWPQNGGSCRPPSLFLPIARNTGLSGELDLQVIEKALLAVPLLARAAPYRALRMSVNLSATLLADPLHRRALLQLLDANPLPQGWQLQAEVLEEAFLGNSEDVERFLGELVEREVLVTIDDFGTGYSSLARLRALPITSFKIDASFVRAIDNAHNPSNGLLQSLGALASELQLQTSAEGAETEAQRRWLLERGFSQGQGFLFAEPMPFEAAVSYLASFRLKPAAISRRRGWAQPWLRRTPGARNKKVAIENRLQDRGEAG